MTNESQKTLIPDEFDPSTDLAGQRIGHYRIVHKISEGGMGEVYEAEQDEPVRRRTALKVIKAGMDTKQVLARFDAERQALALMDHPNIARVFDAGTTDQGRPYFVMELVRGVPITEYCDQHRLTVAERLALFIQTCDAAQHAHQKGVLHRDIKPPNVLVAIQQDRPVPKIIDFGIAKATAHRLTERTMHTEVGQVIGTPEYMSPEQAETGVLDVDTRTDVYSLGVLLYELLTGELPFGTQELRQSGFVEFRRKIMEDEPRKPSARITGADSTSTEAARRRRTEPPALKRQLRGDLDWITMKALEKDRTRRYASASELATDVNRYLRHEPVQASPPSNWYRVQKFVRRHRTGASFAALLLVLLTGFAVVMAVQAHRIGEERDRANRQAITAEEEREIASQIGEFLVKLFEVSDPGEARGNTITAREILDAGAQKAEQELDGQPALQARFMHTIGRVYFNLGLYDQARTQVENALRISRGNLDEHHRLVVANLQLLAHLMIKEGDYVAAQRRYRQILSVQREVLDPDDVSIAKALNDLGNCMWLIGDYQEAERLQMEALTIRRRALEPGHPELGSSLLNLATIRMYTGEFALARDGYEQALAIYEDALGSDHTKVAQTLSSLGNLLAVAGDHAAARSLLDRAFGIRQKVLGPNHRDLAWSYVDLAMLDAREGNREQAEDRIRLAVGIWEEAGSLDNPLVLYYRGCFAALMGAREEALTFLRRATADRNFPGHLIGDPNLAVLRDDPEFEKLVEATKRRIYTSGS